MAKVFQTIFEIAGRLDGSLLSAISTATGALKGLKGLTTTLNPPQKSLSPLLAQLKQLQGVQRQMTRYQQLNAGLGARQVEYYRSQEKYAAKEKAWMSSQRRERELYAQIQSKEREREATTRSSEQKQLDREIKGLRDQLNATRELRHQQFNEKQTAQQGLTLANERLRAEKAEAAKLAEALTRAGYSTQNLSSAQGKLSADLKRVTESLAQQSATNVLKAHKNMANATNDLNNAWDNMSNALTTAQSIMQPFTSATETAMTYEAELSRSRALTQMDHINEGKTAVIADEMAMLDARYKEIGRTTQYTATEAARAGNYLAMAGYNAQQIDAGLASMVHLAIANNTALDRTADIFSNITTSMKIPQNEAGYQMLADRTTYLLTHSNQTLTMLDDTMKYVAPVASALDINLDDLYSAQKFMVDSGVRGTMAGTALKSFLLRSVSPPKKAMEAMAEAGFVTPEEMNQNAAFQMMMQEEGISLENRQGNESMLMSLIRQYNEKSVDWSKERKTAFIEAWAGKYAAPGVMAMLENGGFKKIKEFNEALKASDGAAAQTAGVMADNTRGSWISFQSSVEAAAISIGQAFLPAARSVLDGITSITRSISKFASENPALVQAIGGLATTAAGGVVALGGFRLALAGINFVTTTVEMIQATAAMSALSSMAGGAVGIFGRLTAISSTFASGGIVAGFGAIGTALLGAMKSAWAFITAPWRGLIGIISTLASQFGALLTIIQGQGLAAAFKTIGFALQGAARSALAFLFSPWGMALAAIAALAGAAYLIYSNWEKVGGYFEGIRERIGAALSGAFDAIAPAFDQISAAWGQLTSALNDSGIGSVLLGAVLIGFEAITNVITTAIKLVGDFLSTLGKIGAKIIEAFSLLLKGDILGALGRIRDAFGEGIMGVLDLVKDAIDGVVTLLTNAGRIAKGLWDGSIRNGTFDWSTLRGTPEKEIKPGRVKGTLVEAVTSERTTKEELQVELRNAQREGKTETASTLERQLSTYDAGSVERIVTALDGLAAKSVTDESTKAAFLSELTTALKAQSELSTEQQTAILTQVTAAIEKRSDATALTSLMRETLAASQTATLAQRDDAVAHLAQVISQQSNKDAALTAAIEQIEALKEVSDASKKDMIAQLREALSTEKTAEKSALAEATKAMPQATRGLEGSSKSLGTAANALRAAAEKLKGAKAPSEGVNAQINPELSMRVQETVRSLPRGAETVVDNSQLQASTLALSASINEAAAAQTAVTSNLTATTGAFGSTLMMAGSNVGMALSTVSMQAQTAGAGINQLGFTSIGATGGVMGLGAASAGAQSSMAGLGASASGASGSISGLGSAAISAISALMSAAASAGSAIAGAVSSAASSVAGFFGGGNVAHNAVGGIYPRGEFLTTFAETSPEAAIPIDGSNRAKGLWLQTGRMLGMFPKTRSIISQRDAEAARKAQEAKESGEKPRRKNFLEKAWEEIIQSPIWGGLKMPSIPGRTNTPSSTTPRTPRGSRQPIMPGLPIGTKLSIPMMHYSLATQTGQLERSSSEFQRLETASTSYSQPSAPVDSPITLNFTFNGNVDKEGVKAGVREMIPTFEEQLKRYRHEERRRSF